MSRLSKLNIVRLQPQRHKRVASGHPWVFSNEVVMDGATKNLTAGTIVSFQAHDSSILGIGSFNPHTLIAGRIFVRTPLKAINTEWFVDRLTSALQLRDRLISEPFYRLVHAEVDGLPGLIVDRFAEHLSVQTNTAAMQNLWPEIEAALHLVLNPSSIVMHNDSAVRALEGLPREVKLVHGKLDAPIEIKENGISYYADPLSGQKTGWYFDQRDNHALVAAYALDQKVLDLYCHAGGFGLLAAQAGAASVIGVDSSQPALDLAVKAAKKNKIQTKCEWLRGDVFETLEKMAVNKQKFGVVIADPPPFVKARKDLNSGARGYRKLTRLSAEVTDRDGLLFIASCSHNMALDDFTAEVARGLGEAKRSGRILHTVFAAPDHPVHPHLPESSYLKGLLLQLD